MLTKSGKISSNLRRGTGMQIPFEEEYPSIVVIANNNAAKYYKAHMRWMIVERMMHRLTLVWEDS